MYRMTAFRGLAAAAALVAAGACSQGAQSPVSPSATAAASLAAAADGSTLKVDAPRPLTPNVDEIAPRRPEFRWTNVSGRYPLTVTYRVELLDANGGFVDARSAPAQSGDQSFYAADGDLAYSTTYRWRVRAEADGAFGPWSNVAEFRTLDQPRAGGAITGSVGPQRSIPLAEAFGIIVNVHNELRYDLGRNSSRESRNAFLAAAVAAVHYGHARFNPAGGDRAWCIKDGGAGRPQSDDVLVDCGSRDAWDLIGGAGANGYSFHLDYIGRLPGNQNVYAPPASALNDLNR
jgi:hypothetical protein